MQAPQTPVDEAQRIIALHQTQLLDTPAEARFDRLTRIAQRHFMVPIALVSLVDSERQWFKSRQGLSACETGRDISFCGHAVLHEDIFCIPNALQDPRFADNPLVTGAPQIRFYAGAPLHAPGGQRVGTLCIMGDKPRVLSDDERAVLRDLADAVEEELARTRLLIAAHNATHLARVSEQKLKRFKHALDNTKDMIYMLDTARLRFTYVNEGAVKCMGYSRDELLQLHAYEIEPLIAEMTLRELIAPLLAGKQEALHFETVHRRKDGSDFPVEIVLQLVHEEDGSLLFVKIVRDITERKRTEKMKSEFVSTVSHELRTPLTSISGALGLLVGGALCAMPTEAKVMLDIALKNSKRLTHLINDLLDMEKIAAGKLNFDWVVQPLMPLIEQALETNRAYADQHDVRFTLTERDDRVHVRIDAQRMMQVMANFLSNAAKFSPKGQVVEIGVCTEGAWVRVTVHDHGTGIPDEFRARIFQKFAQADSSDTRKTGGTGLGLAITKDLVEHMGGRVGFESTMGQGTRFHFDLPVFGDDQGQEQLSGKHIPVVMVTGHTEAGDQARFTQAGADGFVAKPIDIAHLKAELERVTAA